MSNGQVRRLPRAVRRLCLVSAAVLVTSLGVSTSPSVADPDDGGSTRRGDPTISQVKQRLDVLRHQAEIASEELNAVREQMKAAQERLQTLQSDVRRQRQRVASLRSQVVGTAVSDFQQAGGLSTTTSFLVADDPGTFLDELATKAMVEQQQTGLLARLVQQQRQLSIQEQQASAELEVIADHKQSAAEHQAEIDRRTEQAQELLSQLEAEERARLRRLERLESQATYEPPVEATPTPTPTPTSTPNQDPTATPTPTRSAPRVQLSDAPASGRASAAVSSALAQLGDPYVYGAAGPSSFDCSGLTMYAWAAAGVSIPHASSMQTQAGTPVSVSSLMPGDLVFYYSPISHVAMYIGDGKVVHAPHTGSFVQIVPLTSMPVTSAVRVG